MKNTFSPQIVSQIHKTINLLGFKVRVEKDLFQILKLIEIELTLGSLKQFRYYCCDLHLNDTFDFKLFGLIQVNCRIFLLDVCINLEK
jgi:hypothetical protein